MPSGSWVHISVKPQGSSAGPRMMGTAAAASRACRSPAEIRPVQERGGEAIRQGVEIWQVNFQLNHTSVRVLSNHELTRQFSA
jgi:hypothetical protein